ncbi:MAG: sugar phosphate isomerase/epimerase family protein [Aureliella sp.]
MYLGYCVYGLVDHYLPDALAALAEIGYTGAILPLGGRLNPHSMSTALCQLLADDIEAAFRSTGLRIVLEANSPFLLSAREPRGLELLGSTEGQWKVVRETIEWSLALSRRLGGNPIILRSGAALEHNTAEATLDELANRLEQLVPRMDELDVDLALQPAEEHFIHNVVGFQRLLQWFDSPRLKLAVDTATMFRQIEFPLFSALGPVRERLAYVTFRDPAVKSPAGDWIGQGTVSCEAVVECLKELAYRGGLFIHSWPADHQALETARAAYQKIHSAIE